MFGVLLTCGWNKIQYCIITETPEYGQVVGESCIIVDVVGNRCPFSAGALVPLGWFFGRICLMQNVEYLFEMVLFGTST